jgi:DNA-binding phage protein
MWRKCRDHLLPQEGIMKSVSYQKILRKKLEDPEQAAEYLTACYEEGPEVFLAGLWDVVQAQVLAES